MDRLKTIRQDMIDLLKKGPHTVRELSQSLSVTEKEAISHLYHVQKSTQHDFKLIIEPATCQKCGFCFENRTRLSKPSKCPKCKHQHITLPYYTLVAK